MLKTFQLATKLLWREWRSGEWWIVCMALILAVTAITSLHFSTERFKQGLSQQSAKLLGGDLAITSPTPIPGAWKEKAEMLHLKTADLWVFPTIVSTNQKFQLVSLEAVSNNYPITQDAASLPLPHNIWVESSLLSLLSIPLNSTVNIGAKPFQITTLLTNDMGVLNASWLFAPKVLIRLEDLQSTRIVGPGSLIEYRLLVAGNKQQIDNFRKWIIPQINSSQRLLDTHTQKNLTGRIIENTENYLNLVLLICVVMCSIAIILSTQSYLKNHYSHIALWRCFGAKEKDIIQILFWQLLIVAFATGLIGCLLGLIAQYIFINLFKDLFKFFLPSPTFFPILTGFLTSTIILFASAYPIMSDLPRTSPLYIWRNEIFTSTSRSNIYLIAFFILILLFLYWFTNFSLLTLFFINLLLISMGILLLICYFILKIIQFILNKTTGTLRRGLSQLIQYSDNVNLQFVGFTLIFTLLLIANYIGKDLINNWHQSLSKDAPNYFVINLKSSDIALLKELSQKNNITQEPIYPIVKGRLVALNKQPILSAVPEHTRQDNVLHRELNLSAMWQFPADNKIVKGRSWLPRDFNQPFISVENDLANYLNFHIGDELTFQTGDSYFSAKIISFRTVDWLSFRPNFFIIFAPGFLNNLPLTYITSFHLASNQIHFLNLLIQFFPNITIIDLDNLLKQIQYLLGKITDVFVYLFLFALAIGILIFITSLQASFDERRQTYRLLRILGASKYYIYKSTFVEFFVLGFFIAINSLLLSEIIRYFLQRHIFGL